MPLTYEQILIIAKLEEGLDRPYATASSGEVGPVPLSISERTLVVETLRWAWMTREERKAYARQWELNQFEIAKKVIEVGHVPYGQWQNFLEVLYGKSYRAVLKFIERHKRH